MKTCPNYCASMCRVHTLSRNFVQWTKLETSSTPTLTTLFRETRTGLDDKGDVRVGWRCHHSQASQTHTHTTHTRAQVRETSRLNFARVRLLKRPPAYSAKLRKFLKELSASNIKIVRHEPATPAAGRLRSASQEIERLESSLLLDLPSGRQQDQN